MFIIFSANITPNTCKSKYTTPLSLLICVLLFFFIFNCTNYFKNYYICLSLHVYVLSFIIFTGYPADFNIHNWLINISLNFYHFLNNTELVQNFSSIYPPPFWSLCYNHILYSCLFIGPELSAAIWSEISAWGTLFSISFNIVWFVMNYSNIFCLTISL